MVSRGLLLIVVNETQLSGLSRSRRMREGDGSSEDLGFKERLHQLVVRAVPERLGLVTGCGSVFGGI